jgi:hypothetical protein
MASRMSVRTSVTREAGFGTLASDVAPARAEAVCGGRVRAGRAACAERECAVASTLYSRGA